MKIKKTIIIVIGVLFVLDLYCAVLGRLHLTVINKKGEPIKGVRVTLQSTKISTSVYKITTDKKGLAIQIGLRNHVFVVTLEKQGYRKYQTHIKIPAGLVQKEIITLKTNEEVIEEQEAKDPHAQAINNFNKAVPLIKEKKYEEALVFLKKSIALDDTIIQSYYYLGVCYYEMEENEAAIEPLKKVIELKEDLT